MGSLLQIDSGVSNLSLIDEQSDEQCQEDAVAVLARQASAPHDRWRGLAWHG